MVTDAAPATGSELREAMWRRSLERRAPRMSLARVLSAMLPRPGAVVVAVIALCFMLPGLGLAGFSLHLADGANTAAKVGGALGLFGVLGTTPAAFLLAVAALFAGRPGARSVLLVGGALLLTVGGVSCGAGMTMADTPIEGGAPAAARAAALFFGPFVLLLSLPAAAFAIWTPVRLHRDLRAEQRRRLLDLLLERGSVSMDDLILATSLDEPFVRRHLAELELAGTLSVRVDEDNRRVATTRRIASRQALLVDLVETRGQLSLAALAGELGEPTGVVEGWVNELLAAGTLSARVSSDRITFDPDGAGSALRRTCASCGGPMRAVGRGLYHCTYCDAEEHVQEGVPHWPPA